MRLPFLANLIVTVNHSGSIDRHSFEKNTLIPSIALLFSHHPSDHLLAVVAQAQNHKRLIQSGQMFYIGLTNLGHECILTGIWSSMIKEEIQQRSEARPFGTHYACHH
ncbi:hypothetical protein HanIR_Chr01g0025031 [Helianthus annuus]|nr:hypothetical protein HanIR_Chr01g0025031 [Helianthus annuus]